MHTQSCITGQWEGSWLSAVPYLLYIPPGKRHHQPLPCLQCPVTYSLGTTAHLGPFFGFRGHLPRVEPSWSTLPAANILLLLFCPGPPAWKLQAEQGHFLHIATIQPWHARTPEELT